MKMTDPQALQDVWQWKQKAYHEVEHLSIEKALTKRLNDSMQAVRQLGLEDAYWGYKALEIEKHAEYVDGIEALKQVAEQKGIYESG